MSQAPQPTAFIDIDWVGRPISIEYQWIDSEDQQAPLMIFLHEGLGSVSMWHDFPQLLCTELGYRGLVYSRPGYGQSTPRAHQEQWGMDFMHRQALEVLPALLDALYIDANHQPIWLFGHSDGGSIALLHAACFTEQMAGLIVLAPHIMVETLTIDSIKQAKVAYEQTNLRDKLGRHHNNPDSAFWGWNKRWLHPEFEAWSIEEEIKAIQCPVLAVQGVNDEYGTLEQIRGIARRVPQTQLLELADCRHSPHRDQPAALIQHVKTFTARQSG
ncbi:alpha/beta fold hydrolase [Leucothrix pacifica]|nr:alpha/beta hydrolase [Leucothrix pacifica]